MQKQQDYGKDQAEDSERLFEAVAKGGAGRVNK
jgi:hypothetical protein